MHFIHLQWIKTLSNSRFSLTKNGSYLFSSLCNKHRHVQFWEWHEQNFHFFCPPVLKLCHSWYIFFILCNLHFLVTLYKNIYVIIFQIYVKFKCTLIILVVLWSNYRLFLNSQCKKGYCIWRTMCLEKQKFILWTAFDLIVRLFYLATEEHVILMIWDCQMEAYFKASP